MNSLKLFIVLLGCNPPGRFTEQHDVFLGIGKSVKELIPAMIESWPEASGEIHVDGWRQLNQVNGFEVTIREKEQASPANQSHKLFFINLGGYKPEVFEEFHYKMVIAAPGKAVAIQQSMQTAFYKHTGFAGATSHVDDKYGIDVDDVYQIEEMLPAAVKDLYSIELTPASIIKEDELHLGYFKLDKL